MKRFKIFVMIGVITSFCANFAWAGSVDVVEVDEDRNALVDVTLCGEGAAIDDFKTWSDGDRFYILFSAIEVGKEGCDPLPQEMIPVPACSEYSKIVALLYSEVKPVLDGDSYKDLSIDSLDVDLNVDKEVCCEEKRDVCIAECVEGDMECVETCYAKYDICMMDDFEITVECHPETLNMKSNGNYITCFLMSSVENGINDIDENTLQLHYLDDFLYAVFSEIEEDYLMVKFSRPELQTLIADSEIPYPVYIELSVSGEQNGKAFEATDSMRVINPGKEKQVKKEKKKKK